MSESVIIRTSDPNWPTMALKIYRSRRPFEFVDDARIGIDPTVDSLWEMGKKQGLTLGDWAGALVCSGIGVSGIWVLRFAMLNPEPVTKCLMVFGGGFVLTCGGGFYAAKILTQVRPPSVNVSPTGGIAVAF